MSDAATETKTPPYGSFTTFWNFVTTGLNSEHLPTVIDRTMMNGKSGTDQGTIFSALKFFDLIEEDDNNAVRPPLRELVAADPDERKAILARMIERYYPGQVAVSAKSGTEKQLHDSFNADFAISGATCRKAATFFLHAASQAELSVSPNFPKSRPGQGPRRPAAVRKKVSKKESMIEADSQGESGSSVYRLDLNSGGSVELRVTVDLVQLMRNEVDRIFVMGMVDAFENYERRSDEEAPAVAPIDEDEA